MQIQSYGMSDLGMSSLGSFLQMLKCNRNFVSNRQKFSSHLVEVYHRSCRCIAMSNNTSSRVPRVVVWWRCWCLVRYGLLPCHSVNKWREKSSFFDILGEPLTVDNYCIWWTQNIFAKKNRNFQKIFRKFVTLKIRCFWNSKEFSENFQKIGEEFQRIVSFL